MGSLVFLNEPQYNFLAGLLPEPPQLPGRQATPNAALQNGILFYKPGAAGKTYLSQPLLRSLCCT